jgi:hypothetical protein
MSTRVPQSWCGRMSDEAGHGTKSKDVSIASGDWNGRSHGEQGRRCYGWRIRHWARDRCCLCERGREPERYAEPIKVLIRQFTENVDIDIALGEWPSFISRTVTRRRTQTALVTHGHIATFRNGDPLSTSLQLSAPARCYHGKACATAIRRTAPRSRGQIFRGGRSRTHSRPWPPIRPAVPPSPAQPAPTPAGLIADEPWASYRGSGGIPFATLAC